MKIVSNDNRELTVERVSRYYEFKTDLDRISAEVDPSEVDFISIVKEADFSSFSIVRANKPTVTFTGYTDIQANENYDDDDDLSNISITFTKPSVEE